MGEKGDEGVVLNTKNTVLSIDNISDKMIFYVICHYRKSCRFLQRLEDQARAAFLCVGLGVTNPNEGRPPGHTGNP